MELEEERRRFLELLPPDTPRYRYSGFEDLEKVMHEQDPRTSFAVFLDIPPGELDENQENFPGKIDYSITSRTLILKIPCSPHEEAANSFQGLVFSKALNMSIRRAIYSRGATDMKTSDRRKQGDQSWIPRLVPPGRSKMWPTVALEVAYSETRAKLKQDMAWWINKSKGGVRLGISIEISTPSGNVCITAWEQGAQPTVQNPWPEPRQKQTIEINRGRNGQSSTLNGNNLVIPFRHLMLRDPGPGEQDLVFTREELLDLAEGIWGTMDAGL